MDVRHVRRWAFPLAIAASTVGCASSYPGYGGEPRADRMVQVPGISVAEIQEMLREGRSEAEIVQVLRSRGTDAPPTEGDAEALRQSGASAELVEALMAAPVVLGTAIVPGYAGDPVYGPGYGTDHVYGPRYGAYPEYGGAYGAYDGYPGYGAVAPSIGAGAWWYGTRPSWGSSYAYPRYGGARPYGGVPVVRPPLIRPPIAPSGVAPIKPPSFVAPPSSGGHGGFGAFGRPGNGLRPSPPTGAPVRPFKPSPGGHGQR